MLGKFRGWSERIGSTLSNVGRTCAIAPLAIAASVAMALGTPATAVAEGTTSTLPALQHEKTIKKNDDGTYTLSLNVTGASETSVDASPVDVVLVMDISRSMDTTDGNAAGDTRLEVAKRAASNLIKTLLTQQNAKLDANKQLQLSVITFDTVANDATQFTADAETAEKFINELKTPDRSEDYRGQTNWEDALEEANATQSNRGAEKHIIFVSDGDPTYRNSSAKANVTGGRVFYADSPENNYTNNGTIDDPDEYIENGQYWTHINYYHKYNGTAPYTPTTELGVHGNGGANGYPDLNKYAYNFNFAVTEANKRGAAKLYAVSTSADATRMQSFAQQANNADYHNGNDEESLKKAFAEIANAITKSSAYSNVVIHDTLSKWATGVTTNNSATKKGFVDPATATYSRSDGQEWTNPPQLTVDEKGNISWDLSDAEAEGVLKDGVTYTVSFKIAPNQAAFDDAAKADHEVTDGQYPSNDAASVTYEVQKKENGKPTGTPEKGESPYETPHMTVPVSKLTVNKVWSDGADSHKGESVTIHIKDSDTKGTFTQDVVLNEDNNWTKDITVAAGPVGHTYTITEDAVGGYTTAITPESGSITLQGITAKEDTATVTNTLETADFTVSKTVAGDAANTDEHFEFTLTANDAKLFGKEYKLTYTGHETDGDTTKHPNKVTFNSTGVATFSYADSSVTPTNTMPLKHGEHVQITGLPVGKSVTVTEVNVSNATVITAVKGNANAGEKVSKAADKTQSYAVDVTVAENNSDDVAFTNTTNHAPQTGISSNVLPMAGLMATAVIGGSALAMEQRKRAAGKPGSDAWKE